jgi:hypothetical protein
VPDGMECWGNTWALGTGTTTLGPAYVKFP